MTSIWRGFFAFSMVLLVLLGFSAPYVEPGTATYAVMLLSTGMLVVMVVGSAVLIHLEWNPFEDLQQSH